MISRGEEGGRASVARPDVQDQFTHDPICDWMMIVVVMMIILVVVMMMVVVMVSKTTSSIP